MSATRFEIRRLNFGEILDEAFKLFRHGFGRFLFFQVLLYAPSIAIFAYALNAAGEGLLRSLEHGEMPPPGDLIAWGFSLIGSLLLLHGVVWPISTVALTSGVADTYLGRRWTIGTILIRALRMALRGIAVGVVAWTLVLFGFLLPILVLVGGFMVVAQPSIAGGNVWAIIGLVALGGLSMLLALVAGVYLSLRFSIAVVALSIEDLSFLGALKRSAALVSGRYWLALGLFLVEVAFGVLAGGLLSAFVPTPSFEGFDPEELKTIIPQLVRSQILSSSLGQVAGMIVGTYSVICWTLFYFTMRCEKEGFDLSYLADRVATGE